MQLNQLPIKKMIFPYYQIKLTLPTSVNNSHTVGKGYRCQKTKKWVKAVTRSGEYSDWLEIAGREFREQFPAGVSDKFTGRLRVDYIFVWNHESRGRNSSDISNREKALSDFLEGKFFLNDNQIDEQHHYRRIRPFTENSVFVRIFEINDRRYDDPDLIFKIKD